MSSVVLGLDLGTTGIRVIAVDGAARVVAQATRDYPLLTPQPGWTEQDPNDWIRACLEALAEVAERLPGREIGALGLSGQMHGMVPLDRHGQVIRPALLWNDQRTTAAVQVIEERIPRPDLIERTGNPAITGFQLPKILWLRQQEPAAYERLRHVLLPKDFLGYVLSGSRWSEPSDASGVGCLDLRRRIWDLDILGALDLEASLFPPLIGSVQVGGVLRAEIAAQTGLPVGLPVVAGGGDNAAAAIGLGISQARPERGSLSLGTSGVIFAPLGQPTPDPAGRIHLFCHADGGYHLLGVTLAAAGSLRWQRETLAAAVDYEDLLAEAARSEAGANGILFLPHLAGERSPYLDPDSRGAWVGLSLSSRRGDLTRALLEGVAYSLKAALEVMDPLVTLQELAVTGGGSRSDLWTRILADVLGMRLVRLGLEEGAAYGAALLAMVGCGMARDLPAALAQIPQAETALVGQGSAVYKQGFRRFQALYEALRQAR